MLRRTFLAAAGVLLAVSGVAGCSTGDASGSAGPGHAAASAPDAGAFPVTIKHAFGETRIAGEPKRIAVVGVNDQDMLLSLGVVPVSIAKVTWGGDEDGTTPWFDAKLKELGAGMPAILDQTDSIPVEKVAAQTPDLILATYSGITREEYDRLAKIAPVVAYPEQPWATTWQDSLTMVGRATGRTTLAAKIRQETEASFAKIKADFPQIQGKTFIWAALATTDLSQIPFYTPTDARPVFLTEIGMVNAPYVVANSPADAFYTQVSAEQGAKLESDFFFTYAVAPADAETYTKDKLVFPPASGRLPECGARSWYADLMALPERERGRVRTYTLRELTGDGADTRLLIDFVLHPGAHGPGSDWAAAAVPGNEILLAGPKRGEAGGGIEWAPGKASRLLLVGDETAVPAIASILRSLPADAEGTAVLEVPVAADVQSVPAPAGVEVTWLPRAGAPVGARAIEAVAGLLGFDPPGAGPDAGEVDPDLWETPTYSSSGQAIEPSTPDDGRYAWIAGESTMVTVLRRHLVGELGMPRRQVAFMGYWRQGVAMKG